MIGTDRQLTGNTDPKYMVINGLLVHRESYEDLRGLVIHSFEVAQWGETRHTYSQGGYCFYCGTPDPERGRA